MIQRNERFAFRLSMQLHETTNRVVSALITPLVTVFIPQPLENPHRRMTLLRRSGHVLFQNLQNPSLERSEFGSRLPRPLRVRLRLRFAPQNLPNLRARMMKTPSNLANAHPITMSTPDPSVIVHRQHPSPLKLQIQMIQSFQRLLRWVHFQRRSALRSGSVLNAYLQSYQLISLKNLLFSSRPDPMSRIEDAGLWMKSLETTSSLVVSRIPLM